MNRWHWKASTREAFWGYLFILPGLLGFLAFVVIPVLASLGLSFCEWDLLTPPKFAGLANFIRLLGFHLEDGHWIANDHLFWKYLYNTLFLMLGVPVSIFGSLFLAILMTQKVRGVVLFRTVYFLPTVCSGVALCLLWKWLYSGDLGLINGAIARVGDLVGLHLSGPAWLTSTTWAKPALMIMGFWGGVGGTNMILYMAALTGVPRHLYEAAEIDGAGSWQKFWHVTWPMVSPTTFFIAIMSVIGGFQGGFMAAYTMTGGGPAGSTTTVEYYIYKMAYENFTMGYASAISWVLFVLVFLITILNWRYGGRHVTY